MNIFDVLPTIRSEKEFTRDEPLFTYLLMNENKRVLYLVPHRDIIHVKIKWFIDICKKHGISYEHRIAQSVLIINENQIHLIDGDDSFDRVQGYEFNVVAFIEGK